MSKRLEAVLRKMKVGELKKEISKQNIKGYSKMRKEEIINLMLDNKKRFKYLVLDNLKQKKELLEDKVKLKKAKEKLEKLTATKIPAKKPEKAEVIKPKPKREPMIPKVIEAKAQTIKKGGKFVTVKKELKDIDLLELKLKNLQNDFSNTKSPGDAKNSKEAQKRVEIRDKLMSEIRKVKAQIFDSKQKNKIKSEKDKKQKEKDELKEFRKKIEEFIENPNDELLQEIDQKFELLEELPLFLQDKFDDAMKKYEFANSKKGKKFKEEVEKLDKKVKSDVDKKLKPKKEEPKKEDFEAELFEKYGNKVIDEDRDLIYSNPELDDTKKRKYELRYQQNTNLGTDLIMTFYTKGSGILVKESVYDVDDPRIDQLLTCKLVETFIKELNEKSEKNNYNIDKIKYFGSTLGEYCKISTLKELETFDKKGYDENYKLHDSDKYSYLV